jgi:predicted dehydrogenase
MSPSAFLSPPRKQHFSTPPRVLVIGAGSRGAAYARAVLNSTNCSIVSVCEPVAYKRTEFGRKFIWGRSTPKPEHEFADWRQWVQYEQGRRERERAGEKVEKGVDAVFVCVLDEMHEEVVCGVAELGGVYVCCEKPMSTSLESCMRMWRALKGVDVVAGEGKEAKETLFGICHVLRYSEHNMLLRQLVLENEIVGDVLSIEHVEPVGYWHFSHSYVRYVSPHINSPLYI